MTRLRSVIPMLLMASAATGALALEISTPNAKARFDNGVLTELTDGVGRRLALAPAPRSGLPLHLVGTDASASQTTADGSNRERYTGFDGLPDASVTVAYETDPASGDLIVTQQADAGRKGLWGVELRIEGIPLDFNILAPVHSGLRFTRTTPGPSFIFDYPMSWEAQMLVVEGDGFGFCVWAEDPAGRFKRLTIDRGEDGWRLGFITMPYAPFEEQSACESVRWHISTYEGDWRVPAKRYRDWMETQFQPILVAEQKPDWVRDIRACVIMGLDLEVLEALPERLDPRQTILYIPGWREAGYDRDYPTYDEPVEALRPFVARAHELGFRVMLHVNYFGVDPLNPLYKQFEPYQCRSPWGDHEKEWWLWSRADPIIKFAYINPAHKPWRDLFVARMAELCTDYGIDSLHLDQTLCIFNDYNGLMDGMSMIDGNIALHRELREALPEVALSGEGLDEITYRHEAFAQRHAYGINHADGTFAEDQLAMSHPLGSYLLRPYTTIYGYLGYAPPTSDQLYAAWNESYQYYGVIPTLKPALGELRNPTGFSAQFFDEARFWLDQRVDVDTDAPWPPDVAFPFRTASGDRVVRTTDRRLIWKDTEISRTLKGASEVALPGNVPGWRAFDDTRLYGLDPGRWYPYLSKPRDMSVLHVEALPEGFTLDGISEQSDIAFVRTRRSSASSIRLAPRIANALCGSRYFEGGGKEAPGEWRGEDGAMFYGTGDGITAHPPYRAGGGGEAYAALSLKLPEDAARFATEVYLDSGAVGEGRSDGVTFAVSATSGETTARQELHTAAADHVELALDLRPFAGKDIVLELSVHPGSAHDPSFDWARWEGPRIERESRKTASLAVAGLSGWAFAVAGTDQQEISPGQDRLELDTTFPGAVHLLKNLPVPVVLPLDLASTPNHPAFVSDTGAILDAPAHACVQPAEGAVGGITRPGLFAHPPDHGKTIADFAVQLPDKAAEFHAYIGLRDGGESSGVVFSVEANGVEVAREKMENGAWKELRADLSPWAGRTVVLSLITDSAGDYICDWALWAEPCLRVP